MDNAIPAPAAMSKCAKFLLRERIHVISISVERGELMLLEYPNHQGSMSVASTADGDGMIGTVGSQKPGQLFGWTFQLLR
jgi:hypothetical protein